MPELNRTFFRILLPEKLESFVSKYAEHWHDTWASSRLSAGWIYGPVYSDQAKQHPMLKPYRGLTDKVSGFKKLNLHYTRHVTSKRATSGRALLRGLAPGPHSSEEMSQLWRTVGSPMSDLTGLGIESKTSRIDSNVFNHCTKQPVDWWFTTENKILLVLARLPQCLNRLVFISCFNRSYCLSLHVAIMRSRKISV